MTKDQILAQPVYKDAIKAFVSKSIDFDNAVKNLRNNKDPQKEQELEEASKSAWALYCYYMGNLLSLADNIRDVDGTAAAEAAKDLRKMVFDSLQGKYEYIMFVTKTLIFED